MADMPLCGGSRCVSQELGDGDDLAATAEGPQCERVTKRMRADVLGIDARSNGTPVHHVIHCPGTESAIYQLVGRLT